MKIENLIFDLGGVILDIDPGAAEKAFKSLFADSKKDRIFETVISSGVLNRFETGEINTNMFFNQIFEITGYNTTPEELLRVWTKMIIGFRPEKIHFIEKLSAGYKLYLLSNTNEMHYQYLNKLFINHFHYPSVDSLFSKTFYSFKLGLCKPDIRIFRRVIESCGFHPSSALFIDDNIDNIESARKVGLQVLHLKTNESFEKLEQLFLSETF